MKLPEIKTEGKIENETGVIETPCQWVFLLKCLFYAMQGKVRNPCNGNVLFQIISTKHAYHRHLIDNKPV